tara:strand:+ start:46 stop:624 length:579 start_codon:yes stop_codon:yes gene_type:complete
LGAKEQFLNIYHDGVNMNTKKNTKSIKKTKKTTNNKKNDKNLILIKDLKMKLEEQKNKNIKLLAEFDNYQKRTILEKENSRKYDGLNLIKDLLPIFDDIDRTINHKDDVDTNSMLEAINMINSKLQNFLSKNSITKIDALKQDFNPVYHEALLQQESTIEEGKVIEEYEKGYLYHDKIIRHSKVVVSKGKNK